MKRILIILSILLICVNAQSYFEDYPPYSFKNAPTESNIKPVIDDKNAQYKSGDVLARSTKNSFILRDGATTLIQEENLSISNASRNPVPLLVYHLDLDHNDQNDFVVFSWWGGAGLASHNYRVDLFLKKPNGSYQKISYDSMSPDIKDFADLDHDGKAEVLITGYYQGDKHNYFSYNVYEFKDYILKNADQKFKGFPKFVWMTNKPNDKDTTHLSLKERALHTQEKDRSISYSEIHPLGT